MLPDPRFLLQKMALTTPLIGLYDAPEPAAFAPLVTPTVGKRACLFAFYQQWLQGKTLHLTAENYGCGGCGTWLFNQQTRTRDEYIKFLADDEGLKASREIMAQWIDFQKRYQPQHGHILVGPLKTELAAWVKTITFLVNPDQLSLLLLGANYRHAPGQPVVVTAPFGSGCSELLPLFTDLARPQAIIGATDIAMRQYLPPEMLAFTVTLPLFEQLCQLDDRSFLGKPFWQRLQNARKTD